MIAAICVAGIDGRPSPGGATGPRNRRRGTPRPGARPRTRTCCPPGSGARPASPRPAADGLPVRSPAWDDYSIYSDTMLENRHTRNLFQQAPSLTFLDKLILQMFPQLSGGVSALGTYNLTVRRPAVQVEDLMQLALVIAEFCGHAAGFGPAAGGGADQHGLADPGALSGQAAP